MKICMCGHSATRHRVRHKPSQGISRFRAECTFEDCYCSRFDEKTKVSKSAADSAGELKPCPFCKSSNLARPYHQDYGVLVSCNDCGARGPTFDVPFTQELNDKAIAAWNTRTQPPAPPMEWSKDKVLPDGYYWMRLSPDDNAPTIIRNEGQVFEECGMEGDVRYTNSLTTAEFCPVSLPAPATQTYETTLALAAEIAHLTATRYSKGTFNDCSREVRACEEIETAIRGLITSPPAPMATRDEVLEQAALMPDQVYELRIKGSLLNEAKRSAVAAKEGDDAKN